ncbi:unnamed protein product [Microthlaspi erraticum]|uniref:Uncharacterized protein n=1 Tax=Microthlaspi erraticum TaxID=1685480 RepID=A0A6D2K9H1_9BRAS|nr:unnamed protein product [Microthlaspi erraticum]
MSSLVTWACDPSGDNRVIPEGDGTVASDFTGTSEGVAQCPEGSGLFRLTVMGAKQLRGWLRLISPLVFVDRGKPEETMVETYAFLKQKKKRKKQWWRPFRAQLSSSRTAIGPSSFYLPV